MEAGEGPGQEKSQPSTPTIVVAAMEPSLTVVEGIVPEQAYSSSGAGAGGGGKTLANILCCLCGRSIQPNGEMSIYRSRQAFLWGVLQRIL